MRVPALQMGSVPVSNLPMAVLLSRDAASKLASRNYIHAIRVETRVKKTEQCRYIVNDVAD